MFSRLAAVLCASVTAGMAMASPAVVTSEFPEETAALVAATASLFDSVEADAAIAPSVPQFRIDARAVPASLPAESNISKAFPSDAGPVRHLTGYRIMWYPVDRFLGAVDFMGTWNGNSDLVCGYVVWDLSDPDAPVMDQLVANYVTIRDLSGAAPSAVEQTLLDANCAFGEIDPNFALFD